MLNVAKFGGTSVADFEAMLRCAHIIKNQPETKLVVLSASAGVTNSLVTLSQKFLNEEQRVEIIANIRSIQHNITQHLASEELLNLKIEQILSELTQLTNLQNTLQTAQTADAILACGEQMSTLIFSDLLASIDVNCQYFDVRNVMKTDGLFGQATVDLSKLKTQCEQLLLPKINDGVVITQGFIGQDDNGNTTTLGRGGSDYSAALLAEATGADSLAIWTDVVGIFTTDPRISSAARPIPEISFGEAAEMATFGAKILHPATLIPAMRSDIPVFVGSSKDPDAGGTRIMQSVDYKPTYRAVALRREQTLVTVKSPAMLHASGFLAKVFEILANHQLSIDLITTSEISVALTFDNPPGSTQALITQTVVEELEQLCEVTVEHGLSLVAVVGNGLDATEGLGTDIFENISNINIRLICHGASPNNLCFLVNENDANHVVKTLHDTLFVS